MLKKIVLTLGQDISNLKTTLSTRCHNNFKSIYITPLPYNESQPWDKIKTHLQGLWMDNDITHDLTALQKDISTINQTHLQIDDLQDLATKIKKDIKDLNPLDWIQYFIFIEIILLLIMLVIFLFPCLIKYLYSSIKAIQQKIFKLHFKNKKEKTATPTAMTPI